MKNVVKLVAIALCTAVVGLTTPSIAQNNDTLKVNPDQAIKKTARKVGNKTAELAVKGASKVADKTYANKVGPGGQTIYIDKNSKYYYVNKKGAKVYVSKAKLRNK
ncbi:hypothetical protein [Arcticibacter eurypsychrophilus]|uniref:hypothetical protein n=1 Tax=Arcticibacter eurypsychrophilus TaxID=1434752 RepID=UPI00084D097D|nr:hypothetical protein [Arcticibacter eurypsychrophilus]